MGWRIRGRNKDKTTQLNKKINELEAKKYQDGEGEASEIMISVSNIFNWKYLFPIQMQGSSRQFSTWACNLSKGLDYK